MPDTTRILKDAARTLRWPAANGMALHAPEPTRVLPEQAREATRQLDTLRLELERAIRDAAPALHAVFDDVEYPLFVITPPINMRVGRDIVKLASVDEEVLEDPSLARGLGVDLAEEMNAMVRLSQMVRDAGFDGLTALREEPREQAERFCAAFNGEIRMEAEETPEVL